LSNETAVAKTDGFTRPDPPHEAPEGYHWQALPADRAWGPAQEGKKCRWRGSAPQACGDTGAVVLTRGIRRPIPWNYCAADALEHYGVWLEDGKVLTWKLRENLTA
jgi:hypothetical protein